MARFSLTLPTLQLSIWTNCRAEACRNCLNITLLWHWHTKIYALLIVLINRHTQFTGVESHLPTCSPVATPIPKGPRAWNIDLNVNVMITGCNNRHFLIAIPTHADTYWLPLRWQHVQGCHPERWVLQSTADRTLLVCSPKKWPQWHPIVGWRQSSNSN